MRQGHLCRRSTHVERLEERRLFSAGDVITSYGTGGVATMPFVTRTDDSASAFAQLPDGRVLVGGNSFSGADDVGTLLRYNADGTPDITFGGGTGEVRLNTTPWTTGALSLKLFADGTFIGVGNGGSGSGNNRYVQKFLADGSLDPSWVGPGTTPGTSPKAAVPIDATRSIYLTSASVSRLQANGTLDTTFGTNGMTTFPSVNFVKFSPWAMAVQSDGALVLCGEMLDSLNGTRIPAVRRYSSTGVLDTTFGTSGTTQLTSAAPSNVSSSLRYVFIQSDGKIVVSGSNGSQPIVARLNSTGTPDTTFGSANGTRTFSNIPGAMAGVLVLGDGKYLATGYRNTGVAATSGPFLTRLTAANGALDSTYGGGDGVVEQAMPTGWLMFSDTYLGLQPSGKLIAASAGFATPNSGLAQTLTRFNADGSIDTTFAPNASPLLAGIKQHYFTAVPSVTTGVAALQSDGKPVFPGAITLYGNDGPLGRLTTGGTADATFGGGDGQVAVDVGAKFTYLRNAAVQGDGKIVTAGRAEFNEWSTGLRSRFLVARVNADGTPDASFGTGGATTSDFGGTFQQFNFVRIASDNGILGAGVLSNGIPSVVRYTSTGQLDTNYGVGGKRDLDVPTGTGEAITDAIALPGGKLLVAGFVSFGSDVNGFLARLNADGSLDQTFGGGNTGYVVVDALTGATDTETVLGVERDAATGELYLGGTVSGSSAATIVVRRFSPDGIADESNLAFVSLATTHTLAGFARDPNGKFLFAGQRNIATGRDFLAIRLTNAGATDTSFGVSGVRLVDGGSSNENATEIFFLDGGTKILLTGTRSDPVRNTAGFSAVELEGDAQLPSWVAPGAQATWDAASKTLTVNGATTINADPGADLPAVNATTAGATLTINPTFAVPVRLGSLSLSNGAAATFTAGSGGGERTLVVGSLSITTGGRLDLANHAMVLRSGGVAAVQPLLASGFNQGTWTGAAGITSSTAATDASHATSLGVASNASLNRTSFAGVTGLTSTDVLVKYTYSGDANLDGQVDIGDLGLLAGAWQQLSGKTWFDGDFTYDGAVNIGDLGLLAGNWQKGVGNPL